MFRMFALGALALGAVIAANQKLRPLARDLRQDLKRYDIMRTMSGDPPFLPFALQSLLQKRVRSVSRRDGGMRRLAGSLLDDLKRYQLMRSM